MLPQLQVLDGVARTREDDDMVREWQDSDEQSDASRRVCIVS
jgi:hypothetical protein